MIINLLSQANYHEYTTQEHIHMQNIISYFSNLSTLFIIIPPKSSYIFSNTGFLSPFFLIKQGLREMKKLQDLQKNFREHVIDECFKKGIARNRKLYALVDTYIKSDVGKERAKKFYEEKNRLTEEALKISEMAKLLMIGK